MKKLLFFLLIVVAGDTVQLAASETAPHSAEPALALGTSEAALTIAAGDGDMLAVLRLLNSGVDADSHYALRKATIRNHPEIIELLLMRGADVDIRLSYFEKTPLMWADRVAPAQLFLQHKADVNAVDNNGESPLLHAVSTESNALVKLLLESQADITQRNNKGQTALDIALTTHTLNEDVMSLLSSSSKPQEQKSSKCILM